MSRIVDITFGGSRWRPLSRRRRKAQQRSTFGGTIHIEGSSFSEQRVIEQTFNERRLVLLCLSGLIKDLVSIESYCNLSSLKTLSLIKFFLRTLY
ncbi:hypothetical protein YC2023_031803 [Brassica napus]